MGEKDGLGNDFVNPNCSYCETISDVVNDKFDEILSQVLEFEYLYQLLKVNYKKFSFDFMSMFAITILANDFVSSQAYSYNRSMLKSSCKILTIVPTEYRHIFNDVVDD